MYSSQTGYAFTAINMFVSIHIHILSLQVVVFYIYYAMLVFSLNCISCEEEEVCAQFCLTLQSHEL